MRQIVIDAIRNSSTWMECIDNGLHDELPSIDNISDHELLDLYTYYVIGVRT